MEAITLPIYNTEGKEVDTVKLNHSVFDGVVNEAAMYQAVNAYRANQRRGLAATKTRGEVSGGGKKPWKQKGTGRARVGSTRSPLWRHGGVVFGPHPRDFSYVIPSKIRALALKSSLNAKVKDNNLIVLENFKMDKPKVKDALKVFANLKLNGKKPGKAVKVLLLLDKVSNISRLALRNIDFLEFNIAQDTNVYEVMTNKKVLITKDGLTQLTNRLKK
jgi:large subunit ribosomal protein L4